MPFLRRAVVVPPGAGIPAKARRARLVALGEAARSVGASAIALGHTADDRAETVLLRILRGAGPRGLAVMPPRSPHPFPADGAFVELVRPLLAARRGDVLAHVARHGIDVAHDPTNDDRAHPRVRLRREVLPRLEELSPAVVRHLNRVADLIGATPLEGPRARP